MPSSGNAVPEPAGEREALVLISGESFPNHLGARRRNGKSSDGRTAGPPEQRITVELDTQGPIVYNDAPRYPQLERSAHRDDAWPVWLSLQLSRTSVRPASELSPKRGRRMGWDIDCRRAHACAPCHWLPPSAPSPPPASPCPSPARFLRPAAQSSMCRPAETSSRRSTPCRRVGPSASRLGRPTRAASCSRPRTAPSTS